MEEATGPGPDIPGPPLGEGPSTTPTVPTGDLRELIRNVIREDPTLLSAMGGSAPSARAPGSGKLLGVQLRTKHGRYNECISQST